MLDNCFKVLIRSFINRNPYAKYIQSVISHMSYQEISNYLVNHVQ